MNIEIRKPELIRRIEDHMQSGRFRDPDDLIDLGTEGRRLMPSTKRRARSNCVMLTNAG
jgi:hypothetical protein